MSFVRVGAITIPRTRNDYESYPKRLQFRVVIQLIVVGRHEPYLEKKTIKKGKSKDGYSGTRRFSVNGFRDVKRVAHHLWSSISKSEE